MEISDKEWIRQSFMLPKFAVTAQDMIRRTHSDARLKFTDTTLGGNFAINPPPQFTENCDPNITSRFGGSRGQGAYYSEALDDNAQLVHFRMGVPSYNSLTNFFTGFYNADAGALARTGRSGGVFFTIGKALGFVVSLPLVPIISVGQLYRFLANKPVSKFYYLKPTMPLYWNAVNTIANGIAVNMGIVPKTYSDADKTLADDGSDYTKEDIQKYHDLLPDIFQEGGGIDIYAVASKAQRLADRHRSRMVQIMEGAETRAALKDRLGDFMESSIELGPDSFDPTPEGQRGMAAYLAAWFGQSSTIPSDKPNNAVEVAGSWYSDIVDFATAELRDGTQFVTFRVNSTGTAQESFSNSAQDSEIQGSINGISSGSLEKRFSFADGNIGDGVVGGMVTAAIDSVKSLLTGAADGVGMSGIAALAGSAFVDIPKHWQSSSASLPRSDFTIELRSPYGNKLSRFNNLYVPLSMLLAMALPISTGKQSYSSPFLIELYNQGRSQSRLAMVDSMSITRGVGNCGFTSAGEPLGIDVTFSVIDLTSIMHMPISSNFGVGDVLGVAAAGAVDVAATQLTGSGDGIIATALKGAALGATDDDNAFSDYLATLGSLSLADQIYSTKKLRLNIAKRMGAFNSWKSPSHMANWAFGTWPGRVWSAMSRDTDR